VGVTGAQGSVQALGAAVKEVRSRCFLAVARDEKPPKWTLWAAAFTTGVGRRGNGGTGRNACGKGLPLAPAPSWTVKR